VSLAYIFRVPGPHSEGAVHASGERITYDFRQVAAGYCPDGWHPTLEAAADAAFGAATVAAPSEPSVDVVNDAPPTREELEAEAARLGIKVDKRWGDRRLMQEVVKALEAEGSS
jgi:hypothetical protein